MPVRSLTAALLCAAALSGPPLLAAANPIAALPALERVTVLPAPRPVADFELSDQTGRPRTLASLRGAPLLIFFGFTHCVDVCPAAMAKLKLLHDANKGELKAARVLMISVDGERDTPAVMKAYLAPLSPDFIGLTGNPDVVSNIAARFSAVAFKGQPAKDGGYAYFHSTQIFLLDKAGRLRASFFDASLKNMATLTRLLLTEK
jgi:protein SCO1